MVTNHRIFVMKKLSCCCNFYGLVVGIRPRVRRFFPIEQHSSLSLTLSAELPTLPGGKNRGGEGQTYDDDYHDGATGAGRWTLLVS